MLSNNNNSQGAEMHEIIVDKPEGSQQHEQKDTFTAKEEIPTKALELEWSDITIAIKDRKLLHGVSGKVKGRFLAIMGGSGSGKVRFFQILIILSFPHILRLHTIIIR